MTSLSERLTRGSASSPSQVDHARRLVADWQLLADLAFADLTLWVPLPSGSWWCVAQVRPLTAPTSRPEDLVGAEVDGRGRRAVRRRPPGGAPGHRGRARLVRRRRRGGARSSRSATTASSWRSWPRTPTWRSPGRRRRWS